MVMIVDLPYARRTLPVRIPDGCEVTVIRKRLMKTLDHPDSALRSAIAAPIEAPPLETLARGRKSACIVICDITRPVPNGLVLPVLIETMLETRSRASKNPRGGRRTLDDVVHWDRW